jgi:hypothetical protein
MEARIAKLEEFATDAKERLVKIEVTPGPNRDKGRSQRKDRRLAGGDAQGFSDMVKWVVGTAIVLGGTAITVMTFVLNNASPKTPPAAQRSTYSASAAASTCRAACYCQRSTTASLK